MRDSLNAPGSSGNLPSMEEFMQTVLHDANSNLPFDFANMNVNDDFNPFNLDSRSQLNDLKSAIERAGSLEAFISSAIAARDQPPSLLAAAMAVRDTSSHMGLSIEDTISVLTSDPSNPFSFPLPELDNLHIPAAPNNAIDASSAENSSENRGRIW